MSQESLVTFGDQGDIFQDRYRWGPADISTPSQRTMAALLLFGKPTSIILASLVCPKI